MRIKDLATRATKLLTGNAYMVFDNGTKVEKVDYAELAKQIITEYNTQTLAGSAQSVKSALDALNSNAYLLNGATLVPSGSDLNTYVTAGNYQIKFTSDANTISNMPVKTAGVLKVEISGYASNNYKRQTFYEFNNTNRHIRYTNDNGNTWSTWEQVPTRAEMDNLSFSSGKITNASQGADAYCDWMKIGKHVIASGVISHEASSWTIFGGLPAVDVSSDVNSGGVDVGVLTSGDHIFITTLGTLQVRRSAFSESIISQSRILQNK